MGPLFMGIWKTSTDVDDAPAPALNLNDDNDNGVIFDFDEVPGSKQCSSRWDAAFCDVSSGAIQYYLPCLKNGTHGLYGLT